MIRSLFLVAALLRLCLGAFYAQGQPNKIIPPSPEAAALARYGDVPVSLYSGTPQIDIPLCELKRGNLKLPISLSYYASGVKVEDVPTWVGLGFTLNAGGVITRTIRGSAEYVNSDGNISPRGQNLPIPNTGLTKSHFDEVVNLAGGASNMDTEPDIFFYNFNGRAGSFYFDKQGKPVFKKYEDLKVEYLYVSTNMSKFIITTEDGTKYSFEDVAYSSPGEISSWYLTKMEDAGGHNSIGFSYVTESYATVNVPRYSKFYYYAFTNSQGTDLLQYSDAVCGGTTSEYRRLTKIFTSVNDSVIFKSKAAIRIDVNTSNARALEEITVKSRYNKVIKNFKLTSTNVQTTLPYNSTILGYGCPSASSEYSQYLNYRLYLDQVTEFSGAGEALPPYKFSYFGRTADGKDLLPNRLSSAQDWDGYYNGQNSNTDLIPHFNEPIYADVPISSLCIKEYNYPAGQTRTYPGANREMELNSKKMGTLSSIRYPTGGYTDFSYGTFEPGESWRTAGGLRVEKIESFDSDNKKIMGKRYAYSYPSPGYNVYFKGYLLYNPGYDRMSPFHMCVNYDLENMDNYITLQISSGPLNDLGTFEGALMGYSRVREIEDGNGYTEYQYTDYGSFEGEASVVEYLFYHPGHDGNGMDHQEFDFPGSYYPSMGVRPDLSWKRGILLGKTVFDDNSKRVTETKNHYSLLELSQIPAIKVLTIRPDLDYAYRQFNYLETWARLDSTTETSYFGSASVVQKQYFEYGSDAHKQLTKVTTIQSDRSKKVTSYTYPTDYQGNSPSPFRALHDKHVISPVIEERELAETNGVEEQVGGTITFYTENSVLPTHVSKVETKNPFTPQASYVDPSTGNFIFQDNYKPVLYFDAYDSQANLIKYHEKDNVPISYLYGYNSSLPIAEVINASNTLGTAYVPGTEPGQILHEPNSLTPKQVTFTVTNAGTIDLKIYFGDSPGSPATANFDYALSGPANRGGTLCVGGNCSGYTSSVSLSSMPAGEYTLTTTGNINTSSSNTYIGYSYPGLKKTATGEIEFYYEGFEDDVSASKARAHTGERCNYGRSFSVGFSKPNSRAYSISWRQWDGSRWVYHEEPYAGAKSFGSDLYVDDIRVLPTDAQMTTYTYDPLVGLTSSTDPNNRTTSYGYDGLGRLQAVKDEEGNVLQSYEYHYAGQQP